MPPSGFRYVERIVPTEEADALLDRFRDTDAWVHDTFRGQKMRRGSICYGYTYSATGRRLEPAPGLPRFLEPLRSRCAETAGVAEASLVQCIVTRYRAGSRIGPHIDAPVFGPVVVGFSLGHSAVLRLRREAQHHDQWVLHGSAYVLAGEARESWTHELLPLKGERYSLTFRSVGEPLRAGGRTRRSEPARR